MRLAVKHSISSSWSSSWSSAVVTHSISSSRLAFSRMLLLAVAHSIYSSLWIRLHFFCSRWILAWVFFSLFCFVWCFLVDKINVRSCVSPPPTTRQTPVGGYIFYLLFFYYYFLKSLLLACPTHTNPPGSGLGTRGIILINTFIKVNNYIFFTMRLQVTHSISSSRMTLSRMLLLAVAHSLYSLQWIPFHFRLQRRWILVVFS